MSHYSIESEVTLEINPHGTLRANADSTNAGTIRMLAGGGGGSTLATHNGNALDVEKLTNTGTIAIPAGGTNGSTFVGDLLNQGTISVNHADVFFTRTQPPRTATSRSPTRARSVSAQPPPISRSRGRP